MVGNVVTLSLQWQRAEQKSFSDDDSPFKPQRSWGRVAVHGMVRLFVGFRRLTSMVLECTSRDVLVVVGCLDNVLLVKVTLSICQQIK